MDFFISLLRGLLGLVVAIPVTLAYMIFRNRVVRTSLEIAAIVDYQVAQIDLAFATGMLLGASGVSW